MTYVLRSARDIPEPAREALHVAARAIADRAPQLSEDTRTALAVLLRRGDSHRPPPTGHASDDTQMALAVGGSFPRSPHHV